MSLQILLGIRILVGIHGNWSCDGWTDYWYDSLHNTSIAESFIEQFVKTVVREHLVNLNNFKIFMAKSPFKEKPSSDFAY